MIRLLPSASLLLFVVFGLLSPACQPNKPETPVNQTDTPSPPSATRAFVVPADSIIYSVPNNPDPRIFQSAVDWYNDAFGFGLVPGAEPGLVYRYATAMVGNLTVILTNNPHYNYPRPVYYWQLESAERVVELRDRLIAENPGKVHPQSPVTAPDNGQGDPATVIERFEVEDGYGNRIGVTNNPIFIPKSIKRPGQ